MNEKLDGIDKTTALVPKESVLGLTQEAETIFNLFQELDSETRYTASCFTNREPFRRHIKNHGEITFPAESVVKFSYFYTTDRRDIRTGGEVVSQEISLLWVNGVAGDKYDDLRNAQRVMGVAFVHDKKRTYAKVNIKVRNIAAEHIVYTFDKEVGIQKHETLDPNDEQKKRSLLDQGVEISERNEYETPLEERDIDIINQFLSEIKSQSLDVISDAKDSPSLIERPRLQRPILEPLPEPVPTDPVRYLQSLLVTDCLAALKGEGSSSFLESAIEGLESLDSLLQRVVDERRPYVGFYFAEGTENEINKLLMRLLKGEQKTLNELSYTDDWNFDWHRVDPLLATVIPGLSLEVKKSINYQNRYHILLVFDEEFYEQISAANIEGPNWVQNKTQGLKEIIDGLVGEGNSYWFPADDMPNSFWTPLVTKRVEIFNYKPFSEIHKKTTRYRITIPEKSPFYTGKSERGLLTTYEFRVDKRTGKVKWFSLRRIIKRLPKKVWDDYSFVEAETVHEEQEIDWIIEKLR